jgi:hypothetical protein
MIISHKHKLIFIKPLKVAGTSFELALRDYCGPEDIITLCTPDDEKISLERNKVHAQNHTNGSKYFNHVIGIDIDYSVMQNIMNNPCYQVNKDEVMIFEPNSKRYYNHIPARKIKKFIGDEIFNTYTKVSIIRNPIDFAISNYYFFNACDHMDFREYCIQHMNITDFDKFYEINGEYTIDHTIKYEKMNEDIKTLEEKIPEIKGLADKMKTFKSKVYRVEDMKERIPGSRTRPKNATVESFRKNFPKICNTLLRKYEKYCKKFDYK